MSNAGGSPTTQPPVPFHSPDRPHNAGGSPTWLDDHFVILPTLQLLPRPSGLWLVQFMFPSSARGAFGYEGREMDFGQLMTFLNHWEQGPESAIATLGLSPPQRGKWTSEQMEAQEYIERELRGKPAGPQTVGRTSVSAEELDL